jgi:hypothetical protein
VRFCYRRSAIPKPNPNPAVACAFAPPVCEPEAEPEQHLLSGYVTPPEDQRSPSADQGACLCEPEPGISRVHLAGLAALVQPSLPSCGRCRPSCGLRRLCAALVTFLRASPPLCSSRCLRATVAAPRAAFGAFVWLSLPSCGPRRLCAALTASMRPLPPLLGPSAPSCGPRRLHAVLPPHLHTLAMAQCILQGPLLAAVLPRCRPLLQSSLHLREDADWGGSCGGSFV